VEGVLASLVIENDSPDGVVDHRALNRRPKGDPFLRIPDGDLADELPEDDASAGVVDDHLIDGVVENDPFGRTVDGDQLPKFDRRDNDSAVFLSLAILVTTIQHFICYWPS
jgi:hypothetical protein